MKMHEGPEKIIIYLLETGNYPIILNEYKISPLTLQDAQLTDDKLHSKLVLSRFVRTVEGDLDLELLPSADDEIFRVVQHGVVLHLVVLIWLPHHVHIPDVQVVWMDREQEKLVKSVIS